MSKPTVLLTGATGFVGRQVIPWLIKDVELHCVSRKARVATGANVTWHAADLLDASACIKLIMHIRPTHLIHLAWNTKHGKFWMAPDNVLWRDAGLALANAFGQVGGKRLIICGTGAEYSSSASSPLDESVSPTDAETLYGQAKNAFRLETQIIADKYGISYSWARIFNVYGAFEYHRRLIPSIIRAIMHNKPAKCTSGRQIRDFIDVRDLGNSIATLALSNVNGIINIGSGHQANISSIAKTIGHLMRRPDLIMLGALPERPGESLVQVPNLTRIQNELGFFPAINLECGLHDAISWWKKNDRLS